MSPKRSANQKVRADEEHRPQEARPSRFYKDEVPGFTRKYPKLRVEHRNKWWRWVVGGVLLLVMFLVIRGFLKMVDELLKR